MSGTPGSKKTNKNAAGVIGNVVRRSITLDTDLDREAHQLLGESSFSAFLTEALHYQVQRKKMERLLAILDEEYGPVPPEEMKKAQEEWRRLHQS